RNIPLALIGGMLLVMALYLGANAAYVYVLTPTEIANVPAGSATATEVIRRLIGPSAATVMAALMMISVVGSLQTGILAGARTPYAMAKDGVFFPSLARLTPGTHVPLRALSVQCV